MHITNPGLTTLNTRKRKSKVTKAKMAEWREQHRIYNKENKRYRISPISFDEYVDMMFGKVKRTKTGPVTGNQVPNPLHERINEHKAKYPSKVVYGGTNSCARKDSPKYTGNLVKGIATMHKSNAVPVIDDQHAKDLANMRR